jgi:hypothetical protein
MKISVTPRRLYALACAAFLCVKVTGRAESTLTVSELQQTSATHGSLELQLRTTDAPAALEMELSYDASSVEVSAPSAVQTSAGDGSDYQVGAHTVSPGTVRVVLSSAKMLALPDGTTLRIPLKAKGTKITNSLPVAISELKLVNREAKQVERRIGTTVCVKGMRLNPVGGQKVALQLDVDVLRDIKSGVGIKELEYFVNGVRVRKLTGSQGQTLAQTVHAWDLPGSGTFELKARMTMTDGSVVESKSQPVVITGVSTTPVKASYAGVVVDADRTQKKAAATGSVQLNTTSIVSTTEAGQSSVGSYSMRLILNGLTMSAAGRFREGSVSDLVFTHPRDPARFYYARLQQEATGLLDRITGVVTDGTIQVSDGSVVASAGSLVVEGTSVTSVSSAKDGTFVSTFIANRNLWGGSLDSSNQAGNYTVVLRSGAGSTTDGVGLFSVGQVGTVSGVVSLSDQSRASQSGWLSKDGVWELYSTLIRTSGFLQGNLDFIRAEKGVVSGRLDWRSSRDSIRELAVEGGSYLTPAAGSPMLPVPTPIHSNNVKLTLSGGSLSGAVEQMLTLDSANKIYVTPPNPNKILIRMDPARGGFIGTSLTPGERSRMVFQGVWLHKEEIGVGFFSSPSGVGTVNLEVVP